MKYVLLVLAVIAFLYGALAALGAKSAVHEIQAGVAFVVFAVTLSGAAVVEAVDRLRQAVERGQKSA